MHLLAEAWVHDLDPFAIELPFMPGGGIRWYGLSYLVGFVLAYLIIRRITQRGRSPLLAEHVGDLIVTLALGVVIGGRLGYCAFYNPHLFIEWTGDQLPWWGVLKINQGGMASHGGILGGIGACAFFAWKRQVPFAYLLDLMAFGGPLGLFLGRMANFVNGELYGRPVQPGDPLAFTAMKFPQEMRDDWSIPQIQELIDIAPRHGVAYAQMSPNQIIEGVIVRVQQGDPFWTGYMQDHLTARYPSQLFAGLTEGIVVFLVLAVLYRYPVKRGLIGGAFCITYAVMRIINEFFRMPDAQFINNGQLPAITQGQLLSFFLLALGITTVVLALRAKGEKLGGWLNDGQLPRINTDKHG
ncbi:MAG: prolipoprotein diacylglyceryl transferase [Planctomycetota bacterium]